MKPQQSVLLIIMSLCLLFGSMGINPPVWAGVTVDHGIYALLLNKYVKDGLVDYRGFKTEEDKLDQYLELLEKIDSENLLFNEQFAFYINAYNAWTIKLILMGYPGVKSIKDLGSIFKSPWKKKICRINGTIMTLNDIEHKILRPGFQDPRVHFAINCASIGCPPLIPNPYTGSILDQQLNSSARAFINDPAKNYFDGTTLYLSKIFKWFAKDFNNDIIGFIRKYADGNLGERLVNKQGTIMIKYLDYDWSLNGI